MKALIITIIFILINNFSFAQKVKGVFDVDTNSIQRVEILKGQIDTVTWNSTSLKENRAISVYTPLNYSIDSTYGVLFVTDGITADIANEIEFLIENNFIQPIVIVGIHNRTQQPHDTIFGDYKFDFRGKEMMPGNHYFTKNKAAYSDTNITKHLDNRHKIFTKYVAEEVIPYVKSKYSINSDKNLWTLGGFSNGGAFTYGFSSDYPDIFGHSIVMSPGGGDHYDTLKSKCNYYICAGKHEPGFLKTSTQYLKLMKKNDIKFIHKTYNSGHKWDMWLVFYLESINLIYGMK